MKSVAFLSFVAALRSILFGYEIPGVLAREDIARIVAVCDIDSRRADFGLIFDEVLKG